MTPDSQSRGTTRRPRLAEPRCCLEATLAIPAVIFDNRLKLYAADALSASVCESRACSADEELTVYTVRCMQLQSY